MARIYVASSWRNRYQQEVVGQLRASGHEVYDFRNPTVGYDNPNGLAHGFQWSEIDPEWEGWSPRLFRRALNDPLSIQGFESDWGAMAWADTCVLVLPSGRSAHLEAGHFVGAGKRLFVLIPEHDPQEPELMYRMATAIVVTMAELLAGLGEAVPR